MTDPHEHEFVEPHTVEVDEDIFVRQQCTYAPIYGSQYSERHDEVFYDEGPRCEAEQVTVFGFDGVYRLVTDDGTYSHDERVDYEESPRTWEDALIQAAKDIDSERTIYAVDPHSDCVERTVEVGGREYVVRWEFDKQYVDHY